MFEIDTWQEILDTIRANRMRSFLTAFSVAWGIFMLIVLLGSGQGLSNGVAYQFRDDAINSIWVYPGQTSVPYKGLQPGRNIQFTNDDHDAIRDGVRGVEHITSRFYLRGTLRVRYRKQTSSFDVRSVHPGHLYLEKTIITDGRFLNDLDIRERRKVAVIGERVRDQLFGKEPPIGKNIEINGVAFNVVGLFREEGGEGEEEKIYLPISTAQRAYGGANRVGQIMLTTGSAPLQETEGMAKDIRRRIALRHTVAPEDERAINVNNNNEEFD